MANRSLTHVVGAQLYRLSPVEAHTVALTSVVLMKQKLLQQVAVEVK